MRITLKKFLLVPRSTPNNIIDKLCNYSTGRIYGILDNWNNTLSKRDIFYVPEDEFAKITYVK